MGVVDTGCPYNRCLYAKHLTLSLAHIRYSANVAERVTEHVSHGCPDIFANPLEDTRKLFKDVHSPFKNDLVFMKTFIMDKAEYVTEQTQFK